MFEVKTIEDFVKWVQPPEKLLNWLSSMSSEGKGTPEGREWLDRWNRLISGEPLPQLEWAKNIEQEVKVPPVSPEQINDGQRILNMLLKTGEDLEQAVETQITCVAMMSEIDNDIELAESTAIIEDRNGRLEGLAKTSKEYKAAVNIVLDEARKEDMVELVRQHKDVKGSKMRADIEVEQLRTRWISLRHAFRFEG